MDDEEDRYADPVRTSKGRAVVRHDMGKFKRGTLRSGSKTGRRVRSRKQAVAIALNQARRKARRGDL